MSREQIDVAAEGFTKLSESGFDKVCLLVEIKLDPSP
jgi:hypothetical protein